MDDEFTLLKSKEMMAVTYAGSPKHEPNVIILDTRDLIDTHELSLKNIGVEVDKFDLHEIITQTIQTALNSNSPILENGVDIIEYDRVINKPYQGEVVIGEANNVLTKGIMDMLKEQGALGNEQFNYIFDSILGKDIVLRKLPY